MRKVNLMDEYIKIKLQLDNALSLLLDASKIFNQQLNTKRLILFKIKSMTVRLENFLKGKI